MKYVNRDFHTRTSNGVTGRRHTHGTRARLRRRRLVGTISFSALLISVTIVCAAQGLVRLQTTTEGSLARDAGFYEEVVVRSGDTLWAIAIEYGDSSRDPRAIVDELRRINGLRSASLQVGDVLRVPTSVQRAGVR